MTDKSEIILGELLRGIAQQEKQTKQIKPSIPKSLLSDFTKAALAIKNRATSKSPCCERSHCVWLAGDGQNGTCFWKECVYDKNNA